MKLQKCSECNKIFEDRELYEYRGVVACVKCIDKATKKRDFERQEIIEEEKHKTKCFKGLDMGDSSIGKANRKILKSQIEIAGKESLRLKEYEKQTN